MFFVVYSKNNKPMQLQKDGKTLQEVKTIRTATIFSEEYKKYFEGITELKLKYIQVTKLVASIFKGTYFKYNEVI